MPFPPGSHDQIIEWFRARALPLPDDFIDKAEIYHDLILSWSQRMNMVSKKDFGTLLERHILDSILPGPIVPDSGYLVDIGSGAGFPAIPLALIRRRLNITSIEVRHKKVLFLKEVCSRLNLGNVAVAEVRLEDFAPDHLFDIATMRALPRWKQLLPQIRRLLSQSGKLIYYERPGKYRIIDSIRLPN
jgi:16S rRNA (guanine527-N7)-methyltransferase